jgi:hypothetical protein
VYGTNPENEDEDHVRAALAEDASFALLYSPRGKAIPVVMDKVKGEQVKSWWFDPGEGVASGPELVPNRGIRTFTPPSEGAQQDWVLVLDAETSGLPAPGVY